MKIISITNRNLCPYDFVSHIKDIANTNLIENIYLREKDLSLQDYRTMLNTLLDIIPYKEKLFVVKYVEVAKELNISNIHLSYQDFLENHIHLENFKNISVSIHNLDEALQCESLGATRLITGHIFATDCKKGLQPRGLKYLKSICENVKIPVYAIGGISYENAKSVIDNGAEGICIMSSLMQTSNPQKFLENFFDDKI